MTVLSDRNRNVEPVSGLSESFGAAVRARRLEMGLTQESLASRAGMSQGALSRLEHGRGGVPTLSSLERLAEAMGSHLLISLSPSGAVQVAFRAPAPAARPAQSPAPMRPPGVVDGVPSPRPAARTPYSATPASYSWRNGGIRPAALPVPAPRPRLTPPR